jgi:hypothetical protein
VIVFEIVIGFVVVIGVQVEIADQTRFPCLNHHFLHTKSAKILFTIFRLNSLRL